MNTVVFIDPITKRMATMPVEMITAYVQHAEYLRLEEAAKVAAIRDDEAATNFLFSCVTTEYLSEKVFVGADYPIHHEHDGNPIRFHVKDTDELIPGYWSFGVGFSADDGRIFDTYNIDWVIEDDNDSPEGTGFDILAVEPPSLR